MCGPLTTVQSVSALQDAPLLLQVPALVLLAPMQVPALTWQQSTAVGLPHVDRAEQLAIPAVEQPSFRNWLRSCTTHF